MSSTNKEQTTSLWYSNINVHKAWNNHLKYVVSLNKASKHKWKVESVVNDTDENLVGWGGYEYCFKKYAQIVRSKIKKGYKITKTTTPELKPKRKIKAKVLPPSINYKRKITVE